MEKVSSGDDFELAHSSNNFSDHVRPKDLHIARTDIIDHTENHSTSRKVKGLVAKTIKMKHSYIAFAFNDRLRKAALVILPQ